jgi:lysophospholipase L1-like esterase
MGFLDPKPPTRAELSATILDKIGTETTDASGVIAMATSAAIDRKGAFGPLRARLANRTSSAVTIVFAGSSTTAGHTTTAANRWVNLLATQATTNPVRTLSEATAASPLPAGIHVVNIGINGATSGDYITSAAATGALTPALVVHMIGSNDFAANTPPATVAAQISQRIGWIDAGSSKPVGHLLVHSFERYDSTTHTYPWAEYAKELRAIPAVSGNVTVVDISDQFRAVGIPSTDPLALMMSDKIHLNDAGHRMLANIMGGILALPALPASTTPATAYVSLAYDKFNRANAALGNAPSGQTWELNDAAQILVNGNTAKATTDNTGFGWHAILASSSSDGVVKVKAGGAGAGLLVRCNAAGEGYSFIHSIVAGAYRFSRRTVGGYTPIYTAPNVPSVGDELSIEMDGAAMVLKVNGSVVYTHADANDITLARHGILLMLAANTVDNFGHVLPV